MITSLHGSQQNRGGAVNTHRHYQATTSQVIFAGLRPGSLTKAERLHFGAHSAEYLDARYWYTLVTAYTKLHSPSSCALCVAGTVYCNYGSHSCRHICLQRIAQVNYSTCQMAPHAHEPYLVPCTFVVPCSPVLSCMRYTMGKLPSQASSSELQMRLSLDG